MRKLGRKILILFFSTTHYSSILLPISRLDSVIRTMPFHYSLTLLPISRLDSVIRTMPFHYSLTLLPISP